MSIIEVSNLTKTFGDKKALDNVDLIVKKGEIFGFLGPNGAGKSTTIRCMMGLIFPDSGEIIVDGMPVNKSNSLYRNIVGYVPSDLQLNDNWTGKEHIIFIQKARGISDFPIQLVERLGVDIQPKAKHLSTGNRQKLAFLLALFAKPELLILDEPTKGLDPLFQELIYEILGEFRNDGGCVFFSSHNLAEVERLCDRIGIIREGAIVANETMDSLRHMHMHIVEATFSGTEELPDLSKYGEVIDQFERNVKLRVEGAIGPVLKEFSRYDLIDISINHASLEDVFLHFYEEN